MPEIDPGLDYEDLSPKVKGRISAYALSKGLSIDEVLEALAIEFVAMGGPAMIGKPKGQVHQLFPKEGLRLVPKEGLKSDS
ncbi:MAG: hypothetical protein Q7T55_09130 [Solirubrobacteraceae bacterium]|nr:hypothetical protein [Solirubrobacteraceae bacterium]